MRAMRSLCVWTLLVASLAFADPPPKQKTFPPEIQAILDKMKAGTPPTAAEQEQLRAYIANPLRKVDPTYQPGKDSAAAAETGIPDDVAAIMARAKAGYPPSDAEKARLKQWAAAAKDPKARAAMLKNGQQLTDAFKTSMPANVPASKSPFLRGEIRLDGHQRVDNTDKNSNAHTTVDVHVTVPVVFSIREDAPALGKDPALSISFMPDLMPDHGVRHSPKGGANSHGEERTKTCTTTDDISSTIPAGEPPGYQLSGELYVDPARPRPYLKLMSVLTGQVQSHHHRHCDKSGRDDDSSGTAHGALPLLPVTYDMLFPGIPFQQLPFVGASSGPLMPAMAMNPDVLAKLPPEMTEAVKNARFSINGRAVANGIQAGKPFSVGGNFNYRLKKQHNDQETVTISTIRVTFQIKPPPGDLAIAPSDEAAWKKWLPLPWDLSWEDASAYGVKSNDPSLAVKVRVAFRSPGRKCKLDLFLRDVSENDGYSTNFPKDSPGTLKGLVFLPNKYQDGVSVDDDGQHAVTKEKVASIEIKVAAHDSGAWGRVEARCDELGLVATVDKTGMGYITIPRDDQDDHVADQFQEDNNAVGKDGTSDEDEKPSDQRRPGDGYTLYEEYRGFIVLDKPGGDRKFVRTDPHKKDLFVFDREKWVQKYYEPYNPGELVLHYINRDLMKYDRSREDAVTSPDGGACASDDHRWVNFNTPADLTYARQFAMVVLRDDSLFQMDEDDKTHQQFVVPYEGGAQHCRGVDNAYDKPLKLFLEVRISAKTVAEHRNGMIDNNHFKVTAAQRAQIIDNDLATTVIHEIGHNIGITHHDKRGGVSYPKPKSPADFPEWHFGPQNCAMRYPQIRLIDGANMAKGQWPIQASYCRDGAIGYYPVNGDEDKLTQLSAHPTCYEQIDVKSDP
jgi:hypothetical protein